MPHRKRVSDPMTQLTLKTVIKWSPSGSVDLQIAASVDKQYFESFIFSSIYV